MAILMVMVLVTVTVTFTGNGNAVDSGSGSGNGNDTHHLPAGDLVKGDLPQRSLQRSELYFDGHCQNTA